MATKKNIPLLSWITASVGLILVLGIIAFLVMRSFEEGDPVPKIVIHTASSQPDDGKTLIMITIANNGTGAVSSLMVEGELRNGTQTVEQSTVTVDYVPAGSTRTAGMYFVNDPKNFELILTPRSYEEP